VLIEYTFYISYVDKC